MAPVSKAGLILKAICGQRVVMSFMCIAKEVMDVRVGSISSFGGVVQWSFISLNLIFLGFEMLIGQNKTFHNVTRLFSLLSNVL